MKNKEITLYIDTSNNKEITVSLKIGDETFTKHEDITTKKSQIVLELIDKLLEEHDLTIHDLTAIEVKEGPGSYTGLRVGISVVNALAYSLKIPVNNKPIGEFVEPRY